MSFTPDKMKGRCPNCGPDRWSDVVGHAKNLEESNHGVWFQTDHRILKCRGCEQIYHQIKEVFSEDYVQDEDGEWQYDAKISHWPETPQILKSTPDWLNKLGVKDIRLGELISDVYKALNANLSVLAVIGVRTVFDRATELLGIDPAKRFDEKISDLFHAGYIGETEKDHLALATDAGSAAAHRGWKPTDEELSFVLVTVESFLHRVFIQSENVIVLKNAIPQKPSRKKKPKEE